MEKDTEGLKGMAKDFREMADICDKLEKLSERQAKGEEVNKEVENLIGQLMIKFMKIQGDI